jgi:acylpyruvate hydrolase
MYLNGSISDLKENDVILTGTPSGVGPIQPGDQVTAGLSNPGQDKQLAILDFSAEERPNGYQHN